jgi:hypothetical protein
MLKGLLFAFTVAFQLGLNQEHYCAAGLGCDAAEVADAVWL